MLMLPPSSITGEPNTIPPPPPVFLPEPEAPRPVRRAEAAPDLWADMEPNGKPDLWGAMERNDVRTQANDIAVIHTSTPRGSDLRILSFP